MDRHTITNYGWIVVVTLVLAVMIALATPFATFVKNGVESIREGYSSVIFKKTNKDNIDKTSKKFDKKFDGTFSPFTDAFETSVEGKEIPTSFTYGDYLYTRYNLRGKYAWKVELDLNTTDRNQTSYGEILETAYEYPVVNMYATFLSCSNLQISPKIPQYVENLHSAFQGCENLTTAPDIPNGVTNMKQAFYVTGIETMPKLPDGVLDLYKTFANCNNLTVSTPIPENVTNMYGTFIGCGNLTGSIEINANPTTYEDCLYRTKITTITGKTNLKSELLNTK